MTFVSLKAWFRARGRLRQTRVCVWVFILLLSLSDVSLWAAVQPDVLIMKDSGNLRVDGRLDDWPPSCRWILDSKNQVLDGSPYWQGPESLSAKIYFSYDDQNLYVAAVVRQKHGANGSSAEGLRPEGDGLEITISSGWDEGRSNGWTRRDVSFLLAPGNLAHHPMVWNQARQEAAPGARLVAKTTGQGYLLEAALPWSLFPGIRVAPGKQVRFRASIHSGDVFSGGMFFRLCSEGDQPGDWPFIRFGGSPVLETPLSYGQDQNDPEAAQLDEGVNGAILKDPTVLSGVVLDASGRPVTGAVVSFWPVSPGVRSGDAGGFRLETSHLYDRTLVRAEAEGLGAAVVPLRSDKPITIRLPENQPPVWESGFAVSDPKGLAGAMCLEWPASTAMKDVSFFQRAVTLGLEPILCVVLDPADPEGAARKAVAVQKTTGRSARYWALLPPGKPVRKFDALNAYRRAYMALKTVVPDSWVLAPGYSAGDIETWEAFSSAEGDALDMALVKGDFRTESLGNSAAESKNLSLALRFLKDAPLGVHARLENPVPVALWIQAGCRKEEKSILPALWLASVWAAWTAEPSGPLLIDWEGGAPSYDSPVGQIAAMLSQVKGRSVVSESYQPGIRVCARQSKDEKLHLLVVNENSRESTVLKVSFKKKKSGVVVEAALNRNLEFELPAQSVAVVHISSKGKPEGVWYGYHNVLKGTGPQALKLE